MRTLYFDYRNRKSIQFYVQMSLTLTLRSRIKVISMSHCFFKMRTSYFDYGNRKSIKFYAQICPWVWPWGQGLRSFLCQIDFFNGNPIFWLRKWRDHEYLRSDMTLNITLMSRIKVISMSNWFFKRIPNILTMEIKSDEFHVQIRFWT